MRFHWPLACEALYNVCFYLSCIAGRLFFCKAFLFANSVKQFTSIHQLHNDQETRPEKGRLVFMIPLGMLFPVNPGHEDLFCHMFLRRLKINIIPPQFQHVPRYPAKLIYWNFHPSGWEFTTTHNFRLVKIIYINLFILRENLFKSWCLIIWMMCYSNLVCGSPGNCTSLA